MNDNMNCTIMPSVRKLWQAVFLLYAQMRSGNRNDPPKKDKKAS